MGTIVDKTVRLKDGQLLIIRAARPGDGGQVLAHVREILREGEFVLSTLEDFTMTEVKEAAWIQENLADPCRVVIIAEHEGQIIGMIDFKNGIRQRIAHHGEFGMSVNLSWRGLGVGRALLVALIEWAEENPLIEKVCLRVFTTNTRGLALYTSLGFKEEGHLLKYVKIAPQTYVDALEMYRFVG